MEFSNAADLPEAPDNSSPAGATCNTVMSAAASRSAYSPQGHHCINTGFGGTQSCTTPLTTRA
jgi:hypothetical protein